MPPSRSSTATSSAPHDTAPTRFTHVSVAGCATVLFDREPDLIRFSLDPNVHSHGSHPRIPCVTLRLLPDRRRYGLSSSRPKSSRHETATTQDEQHFYNELELWASTFTGEEDDLPCTAMRRQVDESGKNHIEESDGVASGMRRQNLRAGTTHITRSGGSGVPTHVQFVNEDGSGRTKEYPLVDAGWQGFLIQDPEWQREHKMEIGGQQVANGMV